MGALNGQGEAAEQETHHSPSLFIIVHRDICYNVHEQGVSLPIISKAGYTISNV